MKTRTPLQWLTILTAAVCAKAYTYSSGLSSDRRCDNGQDYMADPDCTRFWRCANGKPFRFACPAGLHFNVVASVCDWPESAGCTDSGGTSGGGGGGGSTSGGSGGGHGGGGPYYGSNSGYGGDSGYHGNDEEDTDYPYQPGGGRYYTEAPRATSAPVYRPIHRPKRPVYRPDHNSHGGGGSGGGGGGGGGGQHSGQHRGGGQSYDYSSGSGHRSGSNSRGHAPQRSGGGDWGGAHDQRSWRGDRGGYDHDNGGSDYDGGRSDYDRHTSQRGYDSGNYYNNNKRQGGGSTWGGYKGGRNSGGWSYKAGRGGSSSKNGWGGRGGYFGQHTGGNYGRFIGGNSPWQPQIPYPPAFGKQPVPWIGGQTGPVGGIPVQPLTLNPGFGNSVPGAQPVGGLPVFKQPAFGNSIPGAQPVGGINVFKQPAFGNSIPGAQPVGGIPVFKQPAFGRNSFPAVQPVGGIPVVKRPVIGGVGGLQTIGGAIHLPPVLVRSGGQVVKPGAINPGIQIPPVVVQPIKPGIIRKAFPVTLGKPNVGVSNLGQAFIPVIRKNPRLSQILQGGLGGGVGVGGGGYLQFNPLAAQAQGVAMNDWGSWGSHAGTMGTGTGTMGGPILIGGGGSGMMGSGGIMGGGAGAIIPQHVMPGSGGLSKILLPVRFVHPSISSSTTASTTASTASTTAAPQGPINIIINPFVPPVLPPIDIPLPRVGVVGARAGGGVSPTSSSSLLNQVFQSNQLRGGASASLPNGNVFDFSQFSPTSSGTRRCTAQRSNQSVTLPLVQQSGNALTDRKCRALGQLINSFVFVYVENLPGQPDDSCAVQVPDIRVTCNTGSRASAAYSG